MRPRFLRSFVSATLKGMNYISLVRVCIILPLVSPTLLAKETRIRLRELPTMHTHKEDTPRLHCGCQHYSAAADAPTPRSPPAQQHAVGSNHPKYTQRETHRHTDTINYTCTLTGAFASAHTRMDTRIHQCTDTCSCADQHKTYYTGTSLVCSVSNRAALTLRNAPAPAATMSAAVKERLGLATRHRQLWDLWVR